MKQALVVTMLSTLVLSGCASLTKDECLTADWHQIGYEDGARGNADTRIASHREACAKHGVVPDFRTYQDGHKEGLARFCVARNGFVQGRKGYNYSGICPASMEDSFLDGYDAGRQIYAAESTLQTLEYELRSNENSIDRLQQELVNAEEPMFARDIYENERRRIYHDIALMQEDVGALYERNKQLYVEIADAQDRLYVLENRYQDY